ncbi:hypothetical protein [Miltoncostaea oceani]|uniref:hypothetical protein n=1 Tax=Miltoncostaea oceani TaxID=2843216 RepID=UPI001C3D8017|nr:hypothetical protein [Miltoncostaea oceani]
MVTRHDATWPEVCVRCGEPGDGEPIRRRLYWHHPALYALVLLWVLPYIILAFALRRRTTLTLSVCVHHRRVRLRALWAAWGMAAAAVAGLVASAVLGSAALGSVSALVLIGAPVVGIGGRRLVWCSGIDRVLVRTRGASAAFLATVPDWSDPACVTPAVAHTPVAAAGPALDPAPAPSWSSADIGAILRRAWPELAADPPRTAEYERALEGLHPGVIESVAESFVREHAPLPAPALLRMAVLARARSGVRPTPAPRREPAWAPPVVPRLSSRLRAGLITAGLGLAAFLILGSVEQPWAHVSGPGEPPFALEGSDGIGGARLVTLAGLAGLVLAVVLAVLVFRRSTLERLRIVLGLLAGAMGVGLVGALIGLADVGSAPQQIRDSLPPPSAGVLYVVPDVAVGGGLWLALVGSVVGMVISIYGYRVTRCAGEAV